jgi:outer membrane translocation and assembly module TamA
MRRHQESLKIKFKKRKDPIGLLAIIVAVGIGVALIAVSTKLYATTVYATKGDDIIQLEAQRAKYVEMNKELETEIANEQSIVRVEKEATTRLGMVKAKPAQYIDLSNNKSTISYASNVNR